MTNSSIAAIITKERERLGLNQSELSRRLGVTPQAVQAWESGRSVPRPRKLIEIAEALGISSHVLFNASGLLSGSFNKVLENLELKAPARKAEKEAEIDGVIFPWDDDTPLDDDEVYVPFLKEVELSAGSGRTAVEVSETRKLRFGKLTMRRQGVQFDKALCVTVHGDSMSPMLPDGSTVGIDTGSTIVRDGKVYAINQGGQLRIKSLHRMPDGGIRMRSFNRDEYPDEFYTLEEMNQLDITIIGRVFWSSVLW
ncbi:helix-turn-helix transcriptional regulator [Pseudomonas sp. GD03842]|uniref:XRE family transcriptional regulator n=1 Tax=Pseudomonas sp. GD03842 TaxID=2975385 RepID=UPI00244B131A|nr:helix-turn-helix transcriptional regulator [Pseudomonas sp. GD03842]MDH0745765.1 helix-turn-helix transcriptional regulator [Pseudomonas sp. GD03842]